MTTPSESGRGALPAFAGVSFCYFAFAGLFGTYGPLWFESLGYSALAIGTLVALQNATRLGPSYAWAWIADHRGRRSGLMRLAAAASAVASLGLLVGGPYAWVAAVVVVLYLCTAGVMPLSEAALSQWVSQSGALDAGRYGRVRMWGSIGFIAAVTASGFALDAIGIVRFPWIVVGLLVLLVVAVHRLPALPEARAADEPAPPVLRLLREPELAWFFAAMFLTVLAHQVLYAFFSLYLVSLGWSKGTIGLLWALGVVVEVGWFWAQGRWFARLSAHRWAAIAAAVTALRMAAIAALGHVPAVIVLAQCTHALTFAAQHTACIDVLGRRFPGRLRGRGQALYAVIGYGASGVVAGVAGGLLVEAFGYTAAFWAASAAAALGAVCAARAVNAAAAVPLAAPSAAAEARGG